MTGTFIMSVWGLALQLGILDRCTLPDFDPEASRLVFLEPNNEAIPAQVVAVDQDGTVRYLSVGPEECRDQGTLGTEVLRSGELSIGRWIDEGEVAVEARRMTTRQGILHFILTYGIMSDALKWERTYYSLSSHVCYLYVLRQEGSKIRRLLKDHEGAQLVGFDLVDVTGDGWRDVVIRTRTRPQGDDLGVVQVDGEAGTARRLMVPEGCDSWWRRDKNTVVLERHTKTITDEGSAVTTLYEEYRWDSGEARFVLFHRYTQRCTSAKPD
jgi:hypothetical protein